MNGRLLFPWPLMRRAIPGGMRKRECAFPRFGTGSERHGNFCQRRYPPSLVRRLLRPSGGGLVRATMRGRPSDE